MLTNIPATGFLRLPQVLAIIRLAPDREQAFMEVNKGIDMALEKSRGLGRG